jgi:hypothetical protein
LKGGTVPIGKLCTGQCLIVAVADHFTFSPYLNRHLPRTRDHIGKGLHFRNDRLWRKAVVRRYSYPALVDVAWCARIEPSSAAAWEIGLPMRF